MTYVTADLHGFPPEPLQQKLNEIGFRESDRLYVLGDCIDRGTEGIRLLRWIMPQPNVKMLLGNHEAMMLDVQELFEAACMPNPDDLTGELRRKYMHWYTNGGHITLPGLQQCTRAQCKHLFRFLERLPLYYEISVNGIPYVLTHSGLGNFREDKPLSAYTQHELTWNRPSLVHEYYKDGKMVVFGHTNTVCYGTMFNGKPIYTDSWINIDVGVARGNPPLLLRLDDMQEFYVK